MPVLVRNTEQGPTVFSDLSKKLSIEWQGAGDPSGEDLQHVPDDIVTEHPAFIKMLQRGIFVIEQASAETEAALDRQAQMWRERRAAAEGAAKDSIDRQASNDIVTVPCIGPASRGGGECGEAVAVREQAKEEKPPLCSRHQNLITQYVLIESEEFDNTLGHGKRKWQRVALDPRS